MKRSVSIAAAILILMLLAFQSAFAGDVSKTKRHVAMVYDDSTSMYMSDKTKEPVLNWAYANYMTQAFLALLNPQDSLYITYMSDTEKEATEHSDLLDGDTAQAIEAIRAKNDYINKTPIAAVETAYNMLVNLDEGLTDEYWLVILTDGEFTDYDGDMSLMLLEYIDGMAAAGKTLKVVFVAIGGEAEPPEADEEKGLIVYQTGTNEIVGTMSALADNISGRHNVPASRMSRMSGNRLSVDMMLPVRSLIVFNQADGNVLSSISNNKNDDMRIASSYDIKAPEEFQYDKKQETVSDPDAAGTITKVMPSVDGGILSDGRYILTFSDEVDLDNIRVMYEPAIDIVLRYKSGGRTVTNPEDGSVCDVEVVLVNALTGSPLNTKVLPGEMECAIQVVTAGEAAPLVQGYTAKGVELISGETSINTEVYMPGYFTLRSRFDYVYETGPETSPTPTPPSYDASKGPWPPEVTLEVQMTAGDTIDLKTLEETPPLVVVPLFNGERGTLSDLQMGELQLICPRQIEFEVTIDESLPAFLIAPRYFGNPYSTSTGVVDVSLYFKSEYDKVAQSVVIFTVKDMTWLERNIRIITIPAAALVIAILILGILVFRKKFAKGAWLEFTQMHLNMRGEWVASKAPASVALNDLKGRWRMVPFSPERIEISNIFFYPTADDQTIMIPKKSLKLNMGTSKGLLEPKDLKSDHYLQNGYRFYVETGKTRLVFVYHGPKKSLLTKKKGR